MDGIQGSLKLDESKLSASRRVLREYGNMSGATIIFVLDEMGRRQRKGDQLLDGGEMMEKEECEWGAMLGQWSWGTGTSAPTLSLTHQNPL